MRAKFESDGRGRRLPALAAVWAATPRPTSTQFFRVFTTGAISSCAFSLTGIDPDPVSHFDPKRFPHSCVQRNNRFFGAGSTVDYRYSPLFISPNNPALVWKNSRTPSHYTAQSSPPLQSSYIPFGSMSSSESRRSDKRRKARSKRKEDGETPAEALSSPLIDDERFDSNIDEGPKLDLDLEESATDVMSEIVSNICASPGTFQQLPLPVAYDQSTFVSQLAEQPEHERYMNEFRVHLCVAHVDKSCPNDSYTCFDSHSKHTRRPPILIANDEYNYAPTRCRYVQTMHGKRRCPQGDACRYAHSTEEMIYHPLVYKTQLCPHTLSPNNVCTGFGQHCAKAHGPIELRYPAPCNSSPDRIFLARPTPSFPISLPTDIELNITRENPAFCERYHNLKERRRCPKFFFYSEQPCPFVKSGGATKNWRDPSRCPDGDACRYSHTLLEQMYHPNIYKTSPCNNYIEQDPSRCTWGPLCTHAHGVTDMQRQGRALASFDRDVTKAASQAILRPAKTSSPIVESLSDDSTRVRPRFSLPPPLNGNQIWQPTTQDDHALFTRGIWNDPVARSTSSWKSELRVFHP